MVQECTESQTLWEIMLYRYTKIMVLGVGYYYESTAKDIVEG